MRREPTIKFHKALRQRRGAQPGVGCPISRSKWRRSMMLALHHVPAAESWTWTPNCSGVRSAKILQQSPVLGLAVGCP